MSILKRFGVGLMALTVAIGVSAQGGRERRVDVKASPDKAAIWTSDELLNRLAHQPNDAYVQYVAVQLARRENNVEHVVAQIEERNGRGRFDPGRRERADLFNTFSGALAIQESLQLDTMIGETAPDRRGPRAVLDKAKAEEPPEPPTPPETKPVPSEKGAEKPAPEPKARPRVAPRALQAQPKAGQANAAKVSIDSLTGPTIQSHPWETMLAGRKPNVGTLAKCVPEDYYLVEFKSAAQLMAALSQADVWGDHIFTQMLGQANSQDTERRIKKQLGIAGIPPAVLDSMGIEGIAVTGSDLYLADGSDVTLLVQGKQVVAMRKWADGMLKSAATKTEDGNHNGLTYTHNSSPNGDVNVYTADPRPDLHVRSNSLPAFRKVLDAIAGKNTEGQPVRRLGDSTEFAYIRTILPRDAADEDGMIYLSDPFIRRLVGPKVKIGQRRRLIAFNHLKMIEHAALMFRTENGRAPKSFQELAESGCAPGVFAEGKLACPHGGTYTLSADGMSGSSSIFGRPGYLTPLADIPIQDVTQAEAAAYKQFLDEYNQYWRTFFDPIAVRVKVTPQQYRLETVVLPLIDNSIYTGLAEALGPGPVPLDVQQGSKKTILTLAAKLNKKVVLDLLPPDEAEVKQPEPESKDRLIGQSANNMKQIMLAMHAYHDAHGRFPPATIRSKDGKPLLSWRAALLPYIENSGQYSLFKLDEPWDSEENKKSAEKMPAVFRGRDPKLAAQNKTPFVAVVGKDTMFPPDGKKTGLQDIIDGTSNTIVFVEVINDKAVNWAKPDDLEVDPKQPLAGLTGAGRDSFLVAFCDGSIQHVRGSVPAETIRAMFTRNGNEVASLEPQHTLTIPGQRRQFRNDPFDFAEFIDVKKLRRFLKDGIGDTAAIHIHDAAQPIGTQMNGLFSSGMMGGMGFRMGMSEMLLIGAFAQALTNPACITVPVRDAKVVDEFLDEVDKAYAEKASKFFDRMFRPEFYKMTIHGQSIRCVALKFFGINVRFCWGRIGNRLCVVNHPSVFDDLHEAEAATRREINNATGHATLRVRPENWNTVLPVYRLGWEEGHRSACHANQHRIAMVARGWPELVKGGDVTPELLQKVVQLYGVRPYCPDAGKFAINGDKSCTCTIHGGWNNPRQPTAPAEDSATARTIRNFAGMSATLTFLEDGLHAVLTIDRK